MFIMVIKYEIIKKCSLIHYYISIKVFFLCLIIKVNPTMHSCIRATLKGLIMITFIVYVKKYIKVMVEKKVYVKPSFYLYLIRYLVLTVKVTFKKLYQ